GSNSFCADGTLSVSPITPAPGECSERVVDAPVDLQALAHAAGALAIGALAGDADLVDAVLPRRRLDQGDLGGQRAAIVVQGHEQVRLERDEDVSGALLVG